MGAGAFTETVPVALLPPVTAEKFVVTVASPKVGVVPGPSTGVSLATNASAQKMTGSPFQTRSGAPGVVGKFGRHRLAGHVDAARKVDGDVGGASLSLPPRNVE